VSSLLTIGSAVRFPHPSALTSSVDGSRPARCSAWRRAATRDTNQIYDVLALAQVVDAQILGHAGKFEQGGQIATGEERSVGPRTGDRNDGKAHALKTQNG
jgi:hypothetical protein